MKHLCSICVGMTVDLDLMADIMKAASQDDAGKEHIIQVLRHPSTDDVMASAARSSGKIGCHLCMLVLRSLKNHQTIGTTAEEASLPHGTLEVEMILRQGSVSLRGRCGTMIGFPLHVTTGSHDDCRGQEVSMDADSEEVYALIRQWMHTCVHTHKQCPVREEERKWLPTRVIDVGPADGSQLPFIWEPRGKGSGRYIALTHRWRKDDISASTTFSNYRARLKALDMAELPATFQDAIHLTRRLGVRYLWIDALCIIQDSREDWNVEAVNMKLVYETCWLNVSAAASETKEARLFMKRNPRLSQLCRLPTAVSRALTAALGQEGENSVYTYLPSEFYLKSVVDGFLSRRGWVLQERLVSPRTLYFGKEEIYWECNSQTASETCPWGWDDDSVWPVLKLGSKTGPWARSATLNEERAYCSYFHRYEIAVKEIEGYWDENFNQIVKRGSWQFNEIVDGFTKYVACGPLLLVDLPSGSWRVALYKIELPLDGDPASHWGRLWREERKKKSEYWQLLDSGGLISKQKIREEWMKSSGYVRTRRAIGANTFYIAEFRCANSAIDEMAESTYDYWYKMVEVYSTKELTRTNDKLPAISGLAEALQDFRVRDGGLSRSYLKGLWANDLHRGLLWEAQSTEISQKPDVAQAPSWSWASLNGPVKFYSNSTALIPRHGFSNSDIKKIQASESYYDHGVLIVRGNLRRLNFSSSKLNSREGAVHKSSSATEGSSFEPAIAKVLLDKSKNPQQDSLWPEVLGETVWVFQATTGPELRGYIYGSARGIVLIPSNLALEELYKISTLAASQASSLGHWQKYDLSKESAQTTPSIVESYGSTFLEAFRPTCFQRIGISLDEVDFEGVSTVIGLV